RRGRGQTGQRGDRVVAVAGVDGDARQRGRGGGVVQVDDVVAHQAVDRERGLVGEFDGLEAVNGDLAVGYQRAQGVVDDVAVGGGIDDEARDGHQVEDGGQVLEKDRLGAAGPDNGAGAFPGIGADAVRIAGLRGAAGLDELEVVEAGPP